MIDDLDAESGGVGELARIERLGIPDRPEIEGPNRGAFRFEYALKRKGKVIRCHRLAIRPTGLGSQMEGVDEAIGGNRPTCRGGRIRFQGRWI